MEKIGANASVIKIFKINFRNLEQVPNCDSSKELSLYNPVKVSSYNITFK